MDDDIETILLNIIRGTGLKGLTGMNYRYNNIIRPLLNIEKCDILEYNDKKMLNPCIDKTNFENKKYRFRQTCIFNSVEVVLTFPYKLYHINLN